MRVIYVSSDVTYVPDNYLSLLQTVTDPDLLPAGVKVVGAVLLRVPRVTILKNGLGLPFLGAPGVGFALLKNLVRANGKDRRVELLQTHGIPLLRTGSVNSSEAKTWMAARRPDLIVNMRTRNIYKAAVLELPTIGCVNIHHGRLPDYRGTMCDLWAWAEGRPVGFSIHWMNARIDDGDIIQVHTVANAREIRSYPELVQASSEFEGPALLDCLRKIRDHGRATGVLNRTEQKCFSRNPTFAQIAALRRRGLRL